MSRFVSAAVLAVLVSLASVPASASFLSGWFDDEDADVRVERFFARLRSAIREFVDERVDGDRDTGVLTVREARFSERRGELRVQGRLRRFGEAVDVQLLDAESGIRYGIWRTSGRFSFEIPEDVLPVPCAVTVVAGDARVTLDVRRAPEDCGLPRTTIAGLVTDDPIPFATVSVTLDGVTYTTTADASGAYELELFSLDVDELVLVEAEGTSPGTGEPIEFVNLVGTFQRVIEQPVVNVTNVTTAAFRLLARANGGAAPTTDAELRAAETAVDATELLRLAAVIKLVVDDPAFTLPAGQTSLLEFVADAAAVDAFVAAAEAQRPGVIEQTAQLIVADSDLVAGFTPDELGDVLVSVRVANPGFLAREGEVLEFLDATRGLILGVAVNSAQPLSDAFDWSIVDGRLELTFADPTTVAGIGTDITEFTDDPAEIQRYRDAGGASTGAFDVLRTTVGRAYTRIVDGTEVDTVNVESRVIRFVPTIFLADGTTLDLAQPETVATSNASSTLRDPSIGTDLAFSTNCAGDVVCLPGTYGAAFHFQPPADVITRQPSNDTVYGDLVTFSSDGLASGAVSGEVASWNIRADGRLQLDYTDGTRQLATAAIRLGDEYGVFSIFDDGTQRYASYDIWVIADTDLALTEADLVSAPGQFWQSDINNWVPGSFDENGELPLNATFGWEFGVDGSLVNLFDLETDENADGVPELQLVRRAGPGFELVGEEFRLARFSYADRFLLPIAVEGEPGARKLYVIERELRNRALWFDPSSPSEALSFVRPRVGIYRELDVPVGFEGIIEEAPR